MNELTTELTARGVDRYQWSTLTNSVFPGASPESILMYVDYCKARKLDILKKPAHIVPMRVRNADGSEKWRDVVMPGIYEYRTTAQRTGEYAGQDAPVFGKQKQFTFGKTKLKAPESCTITVYRMQHGARNAYTHVEWFDECVGTKRDGSVNSMWMRRPRGQLAKCCEAGALRKAFPDHLGGEPTADEMEGRVIVDVEPDDPPPIKPATRKSKPKPPEHETVIEGEMATTTPVTPSALKMIRIRLDSFGMSDADLCAHFEVDRIESLPMERINDIMAHIEGG